MQIEEIPEHNTWTYEFPNYNIPIVRLRNSPDRLFFRHWEVKLVFPVIVVVFVIMGVFTYSIAVIPFIDSAFWRRFCILELLFALIMFLWSYFASVCMDPGFLPFDWSTTQRTKYTWEEQLEGLAITSQQIEYAETRPRPAGSCFSHTFGRLVIRPDHICGWIANWVGKRNHKQFILMNLWGSLFVGSLMWPRALPGKSLKEYSDFLEFFEEIAFIVECVISLGLFSGFLSQIIDLRYNQTNLKKWKNQTNQQNLIEANQRTSENGSLCEVFGDGSRCMWFVPTPAFGDSLPFTTETPKPKLEPVYVIQSVPILDDDDVL